MAGAGTRARNDGGAQPGRHRARRNAMMVLYQLDLVPGPVADAIAQIEQEHGFQMPAYARELVDSVLAEREDLDAEISGLLTDWPIDRLGAVERSVLRIGMHELMFSQVPPEVAIDEAVELAKRYASPEAAKLVNGVLGAYVRRHEQ